MRLTRMPTVNSYRQFAEELALFIFAFLCICYVIQIQVAYLRGRQNEENIPVEEGGYCEFSTLASIRLFDGGFRNIWALLVLTILMPIVLSSMGDILPVAKLHHSIAAVVQYLCVATIVALITLEFSYIHNLKETASDWRSMLLVALALDFVALIAVHFVLENPRDWGDYTPNNRSVMAMLIASTLAVISTVFIMVLARTAAAMSEGRVKVPRDMVSPASGDAPPDNKKKNKKNA